jgi:hypothetical protein
MVVRGRVELPTFRFSGQPRQALCQPAKTDVTDKRNRARRKVQNLASTIGYAQSANAALGRAAYDLHADCRPVSFGQRPTVAGAGSRPGCSIR